MTESPTMLAGTFPPPPPVRPAAPPNLISQAPNMFSQPPTLPLVAAAPSPAPTPAANPFATSMNGPPARPPAPPRPKSSGSARRFFNWLVIVAMLGGLVAAGVIYGPELMDRATGEEAVDEPDAPLAFPTPTVTPPTIRTATYTVEKRNALGATETYTVTTDYDTGISRTLVDRADTTDLEILTALDNAMIRLVDEPGWYSLPRGDFPVDSSLGRTRWVRTLDELLPPAMRSLVTIEHASESVVGDEPTRHLVVSIDPAQFTPDTTPTTTPPVAPVEDPVAPVAAPGVVPIADPAAVAAPPALPPGLTLSAGTDPMIALEMQLWIDDAGLVRKVVLPPELGGETITVTTISSDGFQPPFPAIDVIQPLNANALFRLGL